jgi:hypothetical protein
MAANEGLVNVSRVTTTTIMAGWVMGVEIPWNGGDALRTMNVYAQVKGVEKTAF